MNGGIMDREYRYWQTSEDEFLSQNYRTMAMDEMASHLGRSTRSVRTRTYNLGLKTRASSIWTDREDEILRTTYLVLTRQEVANLLGRSVESVRNRLKTLGLRKIGARNG